MANTTREAIIGEARLLYDPDETGDVDIDYRAKIEVIRGEYWVTATLRVPMEGVASEQHENEEHYDKSG